MPLAICSCFAAELATFPVLIFLEWGTFDFQDVLAIVALSVLSSFVFAIAFTLFRPYPHRKVWPPYLMTAVAGATAVVASWASTSLQNKLASGSHSFWFDIFGSFIVTPFITSIILLLLYRITVDRSNRGWTTAFFICGR